MGQGPLVKAPFGACRRLGADNGPSCSNPKVRVADDRPTMRRCEGTSTCSTRDPLVFVVLNLLLSFACRMLYPCASTPIVAFGYE